MYPNQKIQGAFGDIFTPNTSATDKLAQQIFAQEAARKAQEARDAKALDDEFAKNMSGIRDVDIPDLTKAYGDWKLANQMAMKQKGGVSPQQQLDVLRKKAQIYDVISKSKAVKGQEEEVRKLGGTHSDNLVDEWPVWLQESVKTPVSKGQGIHDRNYIYDGSNYNFGNDLQKFRQSTKTTEGKPVVNPNDKLKLDYPVYQHYTDNGEGVKQYILGVMGQRKAQKAYINFVKNLPPDEMVNMDKAFKAIPDSQWELMGMKKPDLTVKNPYSEAEQAANYFAQKFAVENQPQLVKTRSATNEALKMTEQEAMRKRLADYNSNLIEGRMRRNPYNNKEYKEGDLFDRIGETEPVTIEIYSGKGSLFSFGKGKKTGTISKGYVYDVDGNPYTGDIKIPPMSLPSDLKTVLGKNGIFPKDSDKYRVENGTIVNMKHINGVTDRNALETYQLSYNKEPQKGQQPNFGRTTQPTKGKATIRKTSNNTNDPLKIN